MLSTLNFISKETLLSLSRPTVIHCKSKKIIIYHHLGCCFVYYKKETGISFFLWLSQILADARLSATSSAITCFALQGPQLPAWKIGERGFVPRAGIKVLKKQNVSSPLTQRFSIVRRLRDREVACSASDHRARIPCLEGSVISSSSGVPTGPV